LGALIVPVGMMFLIFYFLVFRPQTKARKDHESMVKGLKKHDEVVTVGGLFGTVMNVKPESITLRVDENVRVEIEPAAITRVVKPKGGSAAPAAQEKRA
jgi:preprotein translocase subunit YajC